MLLLLEVVWRAIRRPVLLRLARLRVVRPAIAHLLRDILLLSVHVGRVVLLLLLLL